MLPDLIKLFNCVAVGPDDRLFDPDMVNKLAARCGYLVHPAACTANVVEFLQGRVDNYNTTFYKSWADVDSLQEAEMRVLQLLHYLSTYGTDYMGRVFTMNDFPEEMRFADFKVLMPCTERELFNRIMVMLGSGLAMNGETLDLIVRQAVAYSDKNGWAIDASDIANREARAKYYIERGVMPPEPFEIMRILMYAARGNTVIINSRRTFAGIAQNIGEVRRVFDAFEDTHLRSLATVFYRYRRIFLFIRRCSLKAEAGCSCVEKINRIRRLARKLHKPLEKGVLQNILDPAFSDAEINDALQRTDSPFALVRILNYLNSMESDAPVRVIVIRNGRVWIQRRTEKQRVSTERIEEVRGLVSGRLTELFGVKARRADGSPKTVRFPERLELAAPVSEKMFVGSLPYGSRYTLGEGSYVGVYWRNEWGTRDFDLWIVGADGERIGWSDMHKTQDILFSGDMTNADPEATEIMYCRGAWPDCTVRVVRYNGDEGSRFRLFFGIDEIVELPKSYMVDPDTIRLNEDLVSDRREMTVATVSDGRAYFTALSLSDSMLPAEVGVSVEDALMGYMKNFTMLRDILLQAGYVEYTEESGESPDVDLAGQLSKDTLIELFKG